MTQTRKKIFAAFQDEDSLDKNVTPRREHAKNGQLISNQWLVDKYTITESRAPHNLPHGDFA